MLSIPRLAHFAVTLVVIVLAGPYIDAQERGYLDATQERVRQRQREPATGSSGGAFSIYTDGKPQPAQALALVMKLSDGVEFARGQEFVYEAQIRNISDHPVEIPWDLSPADIESTDPRASYHYQTAAICLQAKLGRNRAISMEGPILLFGSPSIKSTIMKLKPGEWVRIKAKGRASSSNPNDAWPPLDLASKEVEGSVEATLIFYDHSFSPGTEGNSHEDSRMIKTPISSNALTVRFLF